jgi:hypothetical protein
MCSLLMSGGVQRGLRGRAGNGLPAGSSCPMGSPSDGRLWSAGRADKHVPRCGNPSARPALRSALRPALPFLWRPGVRDHGRTGTIGAIGGLERTVEVSRQRCRSRWRPWCLGLVVSPAVGRWLTPGVIEARRRHLAIRPMRRMMGAQ